MGCVVLCIKACEWPECMSLSDMQTFLRKRQNTVWSLSLKSLLVWIDSVWRLLHVSYWTLEIPGWTPTHPGGQRASCSSRCPSAWRSTAGGREVSAWSRRPQKFPSARTTSGSRGKVRRGGRGACRFTGLRLCEDTYRKVDKTRVVQIIMLQVCERGSGVYDSVTAWVERERMTPEQRKTRTKEV